MTTDAAPRTSSRAQVADRLTHSTRRLRQTVGTFTNWPAVIVRLAGGRRVAASVSFRTRFGTVIECPNVPGARVPVYEVFAEDCYRLTTLVEELGPALSVVDIGAHVGTFACELARLAPGARIHSFEPSPVTADYLRRNVAANGLSARVVVSEAAVTGRSGTATLSDNEGGSALNTLTDPDGNGLSVEARSFDEVVAEWGGPDLVKIDCEGGEYDLVLNSLPESWNSVRRVVIEYHPHRTSSWATLREWFENVGLVIDRVEPSDDEQGTAWLVRRHVSPPA